MTITVQPVERYASPRSEFVNSTTSGVPSLAPLRQIISQKRRAYTATLLSRGAQASCLLRLFMYGTSGQVQAGMPCAPRVHQTKGSCTEPYIGMSNER